MARSKHLSVSFDTTTGEALDEVARYNGKTVSDVILHSLDDFLLSGEAIVMAHPLLAEVRRAREREVKSSRKAHGPIKRYVDRRSSYLDTDMLRRLDERCSQLKIKRAAFVRRAVDFHLAKPQNKLFVEMVASRYGKY